MANVIKRRAKIFEAGDYPDKGGKYTVEELDTWIKNHENRDIPLSVGHLDLSSNPLAKLGEFGMGFLKNLQRIGAELFADVFLDEDINRLLDRGASKALSIGIDRDSGLILEASLVANPRVASAAIFHKNVAYQFSVDLDLTQAPTQIQEGQMSNNPSGEGEGKQHTPTPDPRLEQFAQEIEESKKREDAANQRAEARDREVADLRARLQFSEDEKKVDALVAAGKILPAHKDALMQFSNIGGTQKFTFADVEQELRPMDALVKVFEAYDPEIVVQARVPKGREVKHEEAGEKFEGRELEVIRERGIQQGLQGAELDKYIEQSQKLKEAI